MPEVGRRDSLRDEAELAQDAISITETGGPLAERSRENYKHRLDAIRASLDDESITEEQIEQQLMGLLGDARHLKEKLPERGH